MTVIVYQCLFLFTMSTYTLPISREVLNRFWTLSFFNSTYNRVRFSTVQQGRIKVLVGPRHFFFF